MFVLDTIFHRLKRGCETMAYPKGPAPALPDRHGGALKVDASEMRRTGAVLACPYARPEAITRASRAKPVALDLGRCIFCAACVEVCPEGAITQTGDHRMAVRRREDLVLGETGQEQVRLAAALDKKLRKLFGRSLRLRQVSAGGCGACEADHQRARHHRLGSRPLRHSVCRFAAPRRRPAHHRLRFKNMELALKKTWDAVPEPKIVIAVGACAIAGGPFIGHPQVLNGAASVVPVDLFIPGCPPHPLTILDGLLRLLDRLENKAKGT